MFLVEDSRYGSTYQVFTWEDPRKDGYTGVVVDDVSLDYDMEAVHRWPNGHSQPEPCIGRAKNDPKHYKVFRHDADRVSAGYQRVVGDPLVFGSWAEYVRLHFDPPKPDEALDERWYDYLDKLDEVSRERRQRAQAPDVPMSGSRDDVAAWVAKRHLIADSGVREVLYLPKGAPPEEIRLLELNDRFAGNEAEVEPVDFGLDVEGAPFRLLVADITSDQLEQIKKSPSRLPTGWFLDNSRSWRRGA